MREGNSPLVTFAVTRNITKLLYNACKIEAYSEAYYTMTTIVGCIAIIITTNGVFYFIAPEGRRRQRTISLSICHHTIFFFYERKYRNVDARFFFLSLSSFYYLLTQTCLLSPYIYIFFPYLVFIHFLGILFCIYIYFSICLFSIYRYFCITTSLYFFFYLFGVYSFPRHLALYVYIFFYLFIFCLSIFLYDI